MLMNETIIGQLEDGRQLYYIDSTILGVNIYPTEDSLTPGIKKKNNLMIFMNGSNDTCGCQAMTLDCNTGMTN